MYTDSRKVAKKFKKTHGKVLRSIDNLPHDEFWRLNFEPTDYVTEQGKKLTIRPRQVVLYLDSVPRSVAPAIRLA